MKRNNASNKSKNGKLIISVTGIIIFAFISYFGYVYFNAKKYDNVIFIGVKVQGIDVGGKTKEEAIKIIKQNVNNKVLNKKIVLKTSKKSYELKYSDLKAKYNIEETVEKAFKYGKDERMFNKYKLMKNNTGKDFLMEFTYDKKYIDKLSDVIEKETNGKSVNASIIMTTSGVFKINPEKIGEIVDKKSVKKDILNSISEEAGKDTVIEVKTVKNNPKVTKQQLQKINTRISSFTTNFASSPVGRAENIIKGSMSINKKLLMPGEVFSFNKTVGPITAAKGYKLAPIILNDKLQPGIGGGICQVSTTLHNAVLRANIIPIERTHHTMPSAYVDIGMDATVDYNVIDYKFKNTLPYPIYIETYSKNKNITFNIYSDSSLNKIKYDIINDVYETIPLKETVVYDKSLLKGKVIIDNKGHDGCRVRVYKVGYKKNKLISKKLIYNDYYKPVERIIRMGT